jgi:ribosomal protein S24E
MELLKERDNKLLSRRRLTLLVDNQGKTPSRMDLVKEVAKKFKVKEELVIIKHAYPQFGRQKTKLIVHLYEDKKKLDMFEHESLLKKHTEQPKPAEKPKEAPAEEAPTEKTEDGPKAETPEKSAEEKPAEKVPDAEEKAPKEETPKEGAEEKNKDEVLKEPTASKEESPAPEEKKPEEAPN